MKRTGVWRSACLGVAVLVGALGATVPAAAEGNAGLDQHIIANPMPSWTARSGSYLNKFVNYVNGVESAAVRPLGGNAATAAEAWQDPASSGRTLLVSLIGFSDGSLSRKRLDQQTRQAALDGATTFCVGATGSAAVTDVSVPGIPGAHQVICRAGKGGSASEAITWGKANVLALVESQQGSISSDRLAQIARLEYATMGTTTAPVVGANHDVDYLIGGGLIVGAIFGVGLSLMRIRRRPTYSPESIAVGQFVNSYAPAEHDEVEAMLAGIASAKSSQSESENSSA